MKRFYLSVRSVRSVRISTGVAGPGRGGQVLQRHQQVVEEGGHLCRPGLEAAGGEP